ncbi:hypothetical protein Glove_212g232 [Diversispora epigaea]|uniref:Uncharacterized protein n=1 Tax=Diversispora epigaea TaxID=1348612 RepID=A0A397IRB5_9GLOM|nr:hypothetical protein Glove_212g232 [Diversispora epigaea]
MLQYYKLPVFSENVKELNSEYQVPPIENFDFGLKCIYKYAPLRESFEECAIQLYNFTPQDEIDKGMFCLFANKSDPKELFAALHNLDEECLKKFLDLRDKCLVP